MFAFPCMLVSAAKEAGMKVPPDPDAFLPEEYAHFQVFCLVQLGRRMDPGEDFDNAKVIASVPENLIRQITLAQLIARGLNYAT